jgi:hypothetical protein
MVAFNRAVPLETYETIPEDGSTVAIEGLALEKTGDENPPETDRLQMFWKTPVLLSL